MPSSSTVPASRFGLAGLVGLLAASVATLVGAVLALVMAAVVLVTALFGALVLGLAGLTYRAKRAIRRPVRAVRGAVEPWTAGPVIEARNVGGHHWVAYGWERHPA